jgi:4-diphosphocytidyl-2-C-methyl-D-erythritol kinase
MLRLSYAKINLGLHITEKRSDGYHNLQTIFFPIKWTDIVEVIPANTLRLYVSGINPCANDEDNICLKAFRLLQHDFCLKGADIYLHKHVPVGAGLGGGSSNAATVLLAVNEVFSLNMNTEQLLPYAAQLGSDCAFFLYSQPMAATGRGEILSPIDISLQGYKLLVVKPEISVNTAQAYQNIVPCKDRPSLWEIAALPVEKWRHRLTNDFEDSVFAQYPLLAQIKADMYRQNAVYAAMSGSGSAIFGIFRSIPDALLTDFKHYQTFCQDM